MHIIIKLYFSHLYNHSPIQYVVFLYHLALIEIYTCYDMSDNRCFLPLPGITLMQRRTTQNRVLKFERYSYR